MPVKTHDFESCASAIPPHRLLSRLLLYHLDSDLQIIYSEVMDTLREIATSLFAVDSIWSVILRGVVWLGVSLVIIVGSDSVNFDQSVTKMKSNLGFFLVFMALSTGLIYFLFGYTQVPS